MWIYFIFKLVYCTGIDYIGWQTVLDINYSFCEKMFLHIISHVAFYQLHVVSLGSAMCISATSLDYSGNRLIKTNNRLQLINQNDVM